MNCRCASVRTTPEMSRAAHAFDIEWAIFDPTDRDTPSEDSATATVATAAGCACSGGAASEDDSAATAAGLTSFVAKQVNDAVS